MLSNFVNLVIAVKLAAQRSITDEEITSYHAYMTHYLKTLPHLFPGATFTPNHHLSLHLSENLQDWGPAAGTHLFGFEQGNLSLQMSACNFYGFKFQLLTKSRFPRSLIPRVIEAPHLLFSFYFPPSHTPEDKTNKMDYGSRLIVQDRQENYWSPPQDFSQLHMP